MLQYIATCCSVLQWTLCHERGRRVRAHMSCHTYMSVLQHSAVCCNTLQHNVVCCSVLQMTFCHESGRWVRAHMPCHMYMRVLQHVAVYCSMVQHVVVCCRGPFITSESDEFVRFARSFGKRFFRPHMFTWESVCMCVCVCVCVCARARMCEWVCVCVLVNMCDVLTRDMI